MVEPVEPLRAEQIIEQPTSAIEEQSTSAIEQPRMGTEEATMPNEAPAQQTEFDQTDRLDDKQLVLKRAAMMTVSAAVSIEKDFMDLTLEQTTLNNLAESRLHIIQVLESVLEREKAINAQLQQDLDKVKEELRQLIEQK